MQGTLSKWTNVVKGWQYRWFVLDENAGLLSYYTSKEKMAKGVRRGFVRLKGAMVGIDDEDDSTFTITVDSKTFHFQARNCHERRKWIRFIETTILKHTCCRSNSSLKFEALYLRTTKDFQKKISESDAYLQILIKQCLNFDRKIKTEVNSEDLLKRKSILYKTNNLLEQVKHAIVLLQIAKSTIYPVIGTFQPTDLSESPKSREENVLYSNVPVPKVVPETSYSGSEEGEFYDAKSSVDSAVLAHQSPSGCIGSPDASMDISITINESNNDSRVDVTEDGSQALCEELEYYNSTTTETAYVRSDGSLDYDAMYECNDAKSFSIENQRSVVKHLLSELKIGMDLTKVTLPIFILEGRSLLEMYADHFAHPEMFVKINELPSELDRMVQVVRWYLCSFHAGRNFAVARKPYNPILGEVFQCFWDVACTDQYKNDAGERTLMNDGPLPWCYSDQLTFVAEQVSHHPPVSAFYAEHYKTGISFVAHVWTKSKFLGLSVGVHNIGGGTVNLMKYNEQYEVTFPSGYGRSIFTQPWVELGGEVTIKCEKTGYGASVEFLTKPFYGGSKHRINAELFSRENKKPFLTITGEWNGEMKGKWSDGRVEEFANVRNLTPVRKHVRPVEQQEENESRNIWKDVTAGIKLNDFCRATNAKRSVEQRQRLEALQRKKEKGIEWEPKYFRHSEESDWDFITPLCQRLNKNN